MRAKTDTPVVARLFIPIGVDGCDYTTLTLRLRVTGTSQPLLWQMGPGTQNMAWREVRTGCITQCWAGFVGLVPVFLACICGNSGPPPTP